MKDIIYLTCNRDGVVKMTKSLPQLARGQIPVKVEVTIEPGAFREPVLTTAIRVADWRQGIDIADVQLREHVITEAEADMIRQQRITAMRKVLEEQGYTVTAPTGDGGDGDDLPHHHRPAGRPHRLRRPPRAHRPGHAPGQPGAVRGQARQPE